MSTLLLSTWSLPGTRLLAQVAANVGWEVFSVDDVDHLPPGQETTFYGGTDVALDIAHRFGLTLLEPPLDLLARLPMEFRRRAVEYARFGDLTRLKSSTFVKPADPLNKHFDAGIYQRVSDIRNGERIDVHSPVLLAEPVAWSAEYRCFVLDGTLVAWSPYLSFSRPNWKPFGPGTLPIVVPGAVRAFCDRFFKRSDAMLPPAFVMDIGLIEDRGWAVVEFNPVWCAGLLGADPTKILGVLKRACRNADTMDLKDRKWVVTGR